MSIEVDISDSVVRTKPTFATQYGRGDGDVGIATEAFPRRRLGVMKSAAEVDRESFSDGGPCSDDRSGRGPAHWCEQQSIEQPTRHLGELWNLDHASHDVRTLQPLQLGRIVDQQKLFI